MSVQDQTSTATRRRPHRRRGLEGQEPVGPGGPRRPAPSHRRPARWLLGSHLPKLYFDERTLDGDALRDFDGVEVVVDRMSAPYLDGA